MFLVAVSVCNLLLFTLCSAWIVDVDSHSEECFFERAKKGVKIALTFQVTDGGFLDVDVTIQGPDGQPLYTGLRESSGKFNFAAYKEGKYKFCFGNRMSTLATKRVMFDVLVGQEAEWSSANQGALDPLVNGSANSNGTDVSSNQKKEDPSRDWSANHTARLDKMVGFLSSQVQGVHHEQKYLLSNNLVHLRLSEHTNAVIVRWVVFEVAIISVVTALQVWYIKRFFEIKTIL